jgi:putative ABC transport system substrate-binding protein
MVADLHSRFRRIGVILNPSDRRMQSELIETQKGGEARSIEVIPLAVAIPADIERAITDAARLDVSALVVVFDVMTFFHRKRLATAAASARLATIFNFREYVEAGGLLSYGPSLSDMWRQSAKHIRKIVDGELPGDIPMEQPTHYFLAVNMQTARSLGIDIPTSILLRADEIID